MELEELDSSSAAEACPPCSGAAARSASLWVEAGPDDELERPDRTGCRLDSGDERLARLADRPRLSEPLRPLRPLRRLSRRRRPSPRLEPAERPVGA
eukprot:2833994-Alexandrium_andersonii.AAC.1